MHVTNNLLEKQSGLGERIFYGTMILFAGLSIILGLRLVYIASGSMAPTLPPGTICIARDIDVVNRLPQRGDIVVFRFVAEEDILLAKRIIGLPGDKLAAEDDILTVNGVTFDEIPGTGSWTADVPAGYIFCMEDDRDNSYDSRRFGCVPIENLVAKILFLGP